MLRCWIQLALIVFALAGQNALAKTSSTVSHGMKPAKITLSSAGTRLDSGQIDNDPLGGIIINRTMTVLGWDFYKSFSGLWQTLHPNSTFTTTVYERATPQFGSEIWVSYKDERVFHTFLAPARSGVKQASRQAVEIAYKNIIDLNIQRRLVKSPDLGPEEM